MVYESLTSEQKVIIRRISAILDDSGCSLEQGAESLTYMLGAVLAHMSPNKQIMMATIDNKIIPAIRTSASNVYDVYLLSKRMA